MTFFKQNFISFSTIIRKEITRFIRIWSQTLLPSIITIVLYFIIFGNLMGPRIGTMGGVSYIEFMVPGLIIMAMITNAYGNVVSSFFSVKFQKNIEEMLISPTPEYVILWGFVVGGVLRGIAVGILVTLVSLCFTDIHIHHWGITLITALLTTVLFSLAGFLNGLFAKNFDDISFIPTFVLTPLTYLGGVFYATELLPPFWQKLTYLNPVFYMVHAFRQGMLGYEQVSFGLSFSVMLSFCVLLYVACLWFLRRGVGIRT